MAQVGAEPYKTPGGDFPAYHLWVGFRAFSI